MRKDYFTSTWLASREPYDISFRNKNLTKFVKKSDSILDIGAGTGAFSRWCLVNNIFFDTMVLVDHDKKLLIKCNEIMSKFCKGKQLIFEKTSTKEFKVKDPINEFTFKFKTLHKDLNLVFNLINSFDVLSMSALIDLLSINHLNKLFKNINHGKVIIMTLCFNGQIRWNYKNSYDKYIVNAFNKEQQSIKEGNLSLGCESIDKVKQLAQKKNFKFSVYDSSWKLSSSSNDDKKFHQKYLETIYKPLKKNKLIDRALLDQWFISKIKLINNGSLKTKVGHCDIIVQT
tara:strand:+ start:55 stop:915 length:861 start_codon:yes stop_codon:yes gene_type:complete